MVRWKRFPDNNVDFTLDPQAVCGYDVFVVHTSPGGLEELLILLNHVRASKPRRLNIIVPYFFYARSDRNEPGKYALPTLMVDLLRVAGALERQDSIIVYDLHAPQMTMAGHCGLIIEVGAVRC